MITIHIAPFSDSSKELYKRWLQYKKNKQYLKYKLKENIHIYEQGKCTQLKNKC